MRLSFTIDSDLLYRGVLKGNFDCIVVYLAIYSQTGLLPNRINVLRRTMLFRINRMFELSSYLNQISIINWYLTFVLFDLCLIPPLSLKCPILSTQSVIPYIWAVYIVYAISPFYYTRIVYQVRVKEYNLLYHAVEATKKTLFKYSLSLSSQAKPLVLKR